MRFENLTSDRDSSTQKSELTVKIVTAQRIETTIRIVIIVTGTG